MISEQAVRKATSLFEQAEASMIEANELFMRSTQLKKQAHAKLAEAEIKRGEAKQTLLAKVPMTFSEF